MERYEKKQDWCTFPEGYIHPEDRIKILELKVEYLEKIISMIQKLIIKD